ncbi:peptide chain release factor N(5)-glutamine methyltransferase [Alteromonas halophila]|uniref:Release factor glutamine methyltransferase n=1 Tax=Alteromonas halophila TaxID=516698 RepID=A0A918MUE5_9ALTE|nr:peptide chain release factor N(5)-glutamine methyltransferase [Alteromonas halophila]GGW75995.1 release factor glutamine methyltransferase [Alteromonas halophila]
MTKPHRIDAALQWGNAQLTDSASPALDARVLLCHALAKPLSYLYTWPDKEISSAQLATYKTYIAERQQGRPIAHITGSRDFWSLTLQTSPTTLIPRPETELLVEAALARLPDGACGVCDLGTGTGAVALAIASERPDVTVLGCDVVPEAVALAKRNAKRNGLPNTHFIASHWFDDIEGRFSVIVSNPPYVESDSHYLNEGDVRFEPASALTSGKDGLDAIRHIISSAPPFLKSPGYLLLEHGYQQAEKVRELLHERGFTEVETIQDLAGLDRVTLGKMHFA